MHGPVLLAREGDIPLEYVVGGDVDKMRTPFCRYSRKNPRGNVVQKVRHLNIVLRLVHIRIGGAVHDHVNLLRIADEPDRVTVGNVQINCVHPGERGDVRKDEVVGSFCGNIPQLCSQLAVCASDKNVHDTLRSGY